MKSSPSEIDDPVWDVTELKEFITFRLSQLNAKLTRQASRILQQHSDLTLVQWRVISIVGNLDKCTFTEIAELSGMDAGQVSRNIKNLVKRKLMLSVIDESDHRKSYLSLSKAGRDEYLRLLPIMRKRQNSLTNDIKSGDLKTFNRIIDHLSQRSEHVNFESPNKKRA